MTALEIIKKHTHKPDSDYSDSWVLAAMKEIAELSYEAGNAYGYNAGRGYQVVKDSGTKEEFIKQLFPEK